MGAASRAALLCEGMSTDLFSCRNCIHNPAQGLTLGSGAGFCLTWGSVIERPEQTTCKYLHRKDLPMFLARGGIQEHEDEFARLTYMADLGTRDVLIPRPYDSDDMLEADRLDPATRAVAAYHALDSAPDATAQRRDLTLATFAGAGDGRKAMTHANLVRRNVNSGGLTRIWPRRVLDLVDEIDSDVLFRAADLLEADGAVAARWEVAHARLSCLQEFGWHVAEEQLMYPMMELGAHVAEDDWNGFLLALGRLKKRFRECIVTLDIEQQTLKGNARPEALRSGAPPAARRFIFEDRAVTEGQRTTFRRAN
ncbi:hypothetical protein WMF45_21640 [Sorangium sp. So ce448]|uniref:hypothetical protein n=1 Tax=Sorangium sp. So ce448 TaxID=3133314 RepID=UPI003F5F07D9